MAMVTHERKNGLLLAEQAASSAHVRHALKQLDRDLVLSCEIDFRWQQEVWRVLQRRGDQPAVWLFDWRENVDDPTSAPIMLSASIVDEAASRRLDSRRPVVDPVKANEELVARLDAEAEEIVRDIAADARRRLGKSTPAKPSVALRMSRDRMRRRGWNV